MDPRRHQRPAPPGRRRGRGAACPHPNGRRSHRAWQDGADAPRLRLRLLPLGHDPARHHPRFPPPDLDGLRAGALGPARAACGGGPAAPGAGRGPCRPGGRPAPRPGHGRPRAVRHPLGVGPGAPEELADLLDAEAAAGRADATGTRKAARLAMAVVERKQAKEGTALTGFKVQTSRFGIFHRTFPDSAFLCIVRDPRDVVASQLGPRLSEVRGAHGHPLARPLRALLPLRPLPPGAHPGGALRGPGGRPGAAVRPHLRLPGPRVRRRGAPLLGFEGERPQHPPQQRPGGGPGAFHHERQPLARGPPARRPGHRRASMPDGPWPASATRRPESRRPHPPTSFP